MIEEQAQVIALKGGKAIIEIHDQSACQNCELSGGCGTGSLGKLLGYRKQSLSIINDQQLQVGQRVIIGLPEKYFLYAGFLMYLLPLLILFLFATVSDLVFQSTQWINAIAAISGLLAGLKLTSVLSHKVFADKLQPQLKRRQFSVEFSRTDAN